MTDQSISQLRSQADAHRDAIARDVELVTDRVAPGRIADRQKARLSQRVSGVRDAVFGSSDKQRSFSPDASTSSLKDRAGDAVQQVKDSTPDSVGGFTQGNPLAAGLIGLGVGLLAATLIPSTPEEQKIADGAQDTLDSAAKQLAEAGQQTVQAVKPAAEDAVAEVKASAEDSVASVKDDAQDAASSVKDTAQSKADEVRSET